jgi:hypothetical protein
VVSSSHFQRIDNQSGRCWCACRLTYSLFKLCWMGSQHTYRWREIGRYCVSGVDSAGAVGTDRIAVVDPPANLQRRKDTCTKCKLRLDRKKKRARVKETHARHVKSAHTQERAHTRARTHKSARTRACTQERAHTRARTQERAHKSAHMQMVLAHEETQRRHIDQQTLVVRGQRLSPKVATQYACAPNASASLRWRPRFNWEGS